MCQLIWLEEQTGRIVGYGEKIETHKIGQYHCAFSLFIFDRGNKRMLIQKRSKAKYHSGGLLSNSCCSHLYKGESWREALARCIYDELGVFPAFDENTLHKDGMSDSGEKKGIFMPRLAGAFSYKSIVGELIENEEDHVFVYYPSKSFLQGIRPQQKEVEEIYFWTLDEIDCMLSEAPDRFTPWFAKAYAIAKQSIFRDST